MGSSLGKQRLLSLGAALTRKEVMSAQPWMDFWIYRLVKRALSRAKAPTCI